MRDGSKTTGFHNVQNVLTRTQQAIARYQGQLKRKKEKTKPTESEISTRLTVEQLLMVVVLELMIIKEMSSPGTCAKSSRLAGLVQHHQTARLTSSLDHMSMGKEQCAVCSVQCAVCGVQRAVCNV